MKNPYETLGVSPESSEEEIKKAYRELAKKYPNITGAFSDDFLGFGDDRSKNTLISDIKGVLGPFKGLYGLFNITVLLDHRRNRRGSI